MATTNKIVTTQSLGCSMNTVQVSIPMLCYMSYPLNTVRNGYKVTANGQGQHSIFTFLMKTRQLFSNLTRSFVHMYKFRSSLILSLATRWPKPKTQKVL
jgi:hypothetical protein